MPLVGVPEGVEASYNGFEFGPFAQTLSIDGRPVYDAAGRTIVYTVYGIVIKDKIVGLVDDNDEPVSTDDELEDIRKRLQQPGGELRYVNKGFGGFTVNVGGGRRDVMWGPKPTLLQWRPRGGNLACEIVWRVEVAMAECGQSGPLDFKLLEFNYRATYSIQNGYTRLTYAGHFSVPMTRKKVSDRTLPYTADDFREAIVPSIADGWRRETQEFTFSEAKTRCDFTIVDEEQPVPLPVGVVRCDASHDIYNGTAREFFLWVGLISARYETAKNYSPGSTWKHFHTLVSDRLAKARKFGIIFDNANGMKKGPIIPLSFRASEPDIFGRNKSAFAFSYTFGASLNVLLAASGLYQPVPGTNYKTWKASLANTAFHPRGHAGLKLSKDQDAILDLCVQEKRVIASTPVPPDYKGIKLEPIKFPCPPPAESFLHYDLRVSTRFKDSTIALQTLPEKPITAEAYTATMKEFGYTSQSENQDFAAQMLSNKIAEIPYSPMSSSAIDVQIPVPVAIVVTLSGAALRACYTLSPPALVAVGDAKAVPIREDDNFFEQWIASNRGGIPIIAARWRLSYILLGTPNVALGVPPNPMLGV